MRNLIILILVSSISYLVNGQTQIGNDIVGNGGELLGSSIGISGNGNRVIAGIEYKNRARVFEEINGSWIQVGTDIVDTLESFGTSVAMTQSGNRVAVVGYHHYTDGVLNYQHGHIQIYEETNGIWTQIARIVDSTNFNEFGKVLSFSGDGKRIVSGDSFAERVYVYEEISGNWTLVHKGLGPGTTFDYYGQSVSLSADGKRLAIGYEKYGSPGAILIFDDNSVDWVLNHQIFNDTYDESLGRQVSLSADGKRVACSSVETCGKVIIYEEQGTAWNQLGNTINCSLNGEGFGNAVSLSSDGYKVAVGSPYFSGYSGRISTFEYSGGSWQEIGMTIQGDAPGDWWGELVVMSADGQRIASSAPYNSNNGASAGLVRVYGGLILPVDQVSLPDKLDIHVFPNPSNGSATIVLENPSLKNASIKITDQLGRVIVEKQISDGQSIEKIPVYIDQTGLFFIEATVKDKTIQSQLVISR